jgi:hypothetical protein
VRMIMGRLESSDLGNAVRADGSICELIMIPVSTT